MSFRPQCRLRVFCFAAGCLILGVTGTLSGATRIWDGSSSNQWATAANWTTNVAPVAGDALVFPTGIATKSMSNGLAANISLLSLTFQDSGYSVTGNPITLSGGVGDGITTSSSTLVNIDITLASVETFSASAGGNLVLSGAIALGANDLTLTGAGEIDIAGTVTGSSGSEITFSGAGRKEIRTSGNVAPGSGGATSATAGNVLMVNGVFSSAGTLTVGSSSVLGGTGSVSALLVNGSVAPGDNNVGRLTATGSVSFANTAGANLSLELGSASTAGTTYDQLRCNSTVSIFGVATLNLTAVAGYAPSLGQVFTLLDKVNAGAISGTFSGLPEGGTVALAGTTLRISYVGGNGNDITATVIDSTANDPPVNSVPGAQNTNEDTARVFSAANGNQISISDPDAGSSSVRVTLTATNGTTSLGSLTGLTFSSGDGTNDAVMTFSGSIANCNAAMATLTFNPTANFSGAASLQIGTNDLGNTTSSGVGAAQTDTDTIAINVAAVNDAPVNTVPGAQTVAEDGGRVFSAANGNAISVADVDAGSGLIQVQLTGTSGTVTLGATSGLTFTAGDGTADATMTFTGTVGNINTALSGMVFSPSANFTGAASLAIVTNDQGNTGSGGAQADSDSVIVTVTAVNDPPVNALPPAQNVNEDTALVLSTANGNPVSISDLDAGNAAVRVQLTASGGRLTLNGTTGLIFTVGDGTSDSSMTFDGTLTNINNALNGLSYLPNANINGSVSISIVTSDLGNSGSGGALSDSDSLTVNVAAVNDPPVITLTSNTQSGTEDTPKVLQGNFITISDNDAGSGNAVEVTLTCTNGTATLNGTTGLTFSAGDGTNDAQMVFTGTMSNINSRLSLMTFTPPQNFNGAAQLQIAVNDLGQTGNGGPQSDTETITFNFAAVNDAPVNVLPPAQTIAEESSLTFTGATALTTADLDAESNPIRVTLTGGSGVVTLSTVAGLTFTAGDGTSDATMTFTGAQSAIQAALDGMVFSPNANFHGAATLQIVTNDQGHTGSGGAAQDSDTLTITVTNVPDTRTWVATSQTNWSVASNWSPAGAPDPGDNLIFPAGQSQSSSNQDIGFGPVFGSITVSGGGYNISGNSLSCTSLSFINVPAPAFFNASLFLNADLVITASNSAAVRFSQVNTGTSTLEVATTGATDQVTGNSVIHGSGNLRKTGPGLLILSETNSYSGTTTVDTGTLRLTNLSKPGDTNGATSIAPGAILQWQPSLALTTAEPLTLAGTLSTNQLSATFTGPVTLSGNPQIQAGTGGITFSGAIGGSGQARSTGTVSLSATATATAAGWVVDSGVLNVNGNASSMPVVLSGGSLGGTGSAGNVTVDGDGGSIAAGASIGTLTTGGLDLSGGVATLIVEAASAGHDQLIVNGSVNLGNATLTLVNTGNFAPAIGQVLVLINNDGNDAVTGTLNGASEGATISLAFMPFTVSYVGGDGNDVTITRVDAAVTGVTRVWDGGGGNNLWSNAVNWVGDVAPAQGDTIRIPAGSIPTQNDLPADFSINRLELDGSGYFITGNRLRLLGDVEHSGSAQSSGVTVQTAFLLTKNTTFRQAATGPNSLTTYDGAIEISGFNLTLEDASNDAGVDLIIRSRVSGTGKVICSGGGTVSIRQPSNGFQAWTGGTEVIGGTLEGDGTFSVRSPLRLGGGAQHTTVQPVGSAQSWLEDEADITFLPASSLLLASSINTGDLIFNGGGGIGVSLSGSFNSTVFVRGHIRYLANGSSNIVLPVQFSTAGDHELEVAAGVTKVLTNRFVASTGARMVKTGAGTLRLENQAISGNFSTAPMEIREGRLVFTNNYQLVPVQLNGGSLGSFTDTSTRIGALTAGANGGTIALGDSANGQGFRVAGLQTDAITLNASTTFAAAIDTRAPKGLGQNRTDKLVANQAVTLNNAILQLVPQSGFEGYAGETLTLIENNSGLAISGTFAGVPEGHVITIGQFTFRCSYTGNDGNDFVVTVGVLPTGVTRVWDGGGSNSNWTTAGNWVGDVAPVSGDSLEFPAGALRANNVVDYPQGTTFHELRVSGTGYNFNSGPLTLTGGIQVSSSSSGFNFLGSLRLAGAQTISTSGPVSVSFAATLLSPQLTLNIGAGLNEYSSGNSINVDNRQAALITKTGVGPIFIEQNAGGVAGLNLKVDAGTLRVRNLVGDIEVGGAGQPAKALVIGPVANQGAANIFGTLSVKTQGLLEFRDQGLANISRVVLDGGGIAQSAFSGSAASTLNVTESFTALGGIVYSVPSRVTAAENSGGPVALMVDTATRINLTGEAGRNNASSYFVKQGLGTVALSGAAALTNPLERLDVAGGQALVNANLAGLHIKLAGGLIGGTGTVASIETVSNGSVAPGLSPGLLRSGSIAWNEDSNFVVELGGTTPGATYDQLEVSGAAILGDAALSLVSFNGFLPVDGQQFLLVSKTGAGAFTGTFAGLPDGGSFAALGRLFTINYAAGDGNDIAITCHGYDPTDSDNDTLPDGWEQEFFGNLSSGANDDPDGDGKTNRQEFVAGTSPINYGSALRASTVSGPAGGMTISVRPIVAGRTYTLERSTTGPDANSFQPVPNATFTDIGDERRFTDPAPPAGRAFYRVTVELSP